MNNNQINDDSLKHLAYPKINFSAFIVINNNKIQNSNSNNNFNKNLDSSSGQAKLLGENFINTSDFYEKIFSQNSDYIKHSLNFLRKTEGDIAVVGKLNLQLKFTLQNIVNNEAMKKLINQVENDDIHKLPEMDNKTPYIWRIRIFLRSATNLPFKNSKEKNNNTNLNVNKAGELPSPFIELGWTQYYQEDLNFTECIRSFYIENNRFPIWNQEFIYYPPKEINFSNNPSNGFFNIIIRNADEPEAIKKITFPIETLRSFHPVNADFVFGNETQKEKSHLYMSLILEEVNFDIFELIK